ncbi:sec1 family domain-containing protein 2-like [Ornithodoros turicata]|uniref:sec1 family domain-containing protein 2-like n=1 Tax=Ornithodoros turicata TaxID=34597 RepID=UPI003138BAB3
MHESSIALDKIAAQLWTAEVIPRVKGAVVYMDNHMAEAVHWNRGVTWILESGAVAVRELSYFECGLDKSEEKAVFLVGVPLVGSCWSQISAVVRASCFTSCTVITSCPASAHHSALYGATPHPQQELRNSFLHLEEQLLDWMGNMNFSVKVIYIPLALISVAPSFFLMPQFRDVFPMLPVFQDTNEKLVQELGALPRPLHTDIQSLVGNLYSLLESLNVKADIFSLGPTSHLIGEELERYARNSKNGRGLTLILVDRTMDMAGALTSACDSVMDRVVRVLPPLASGHSVDVQVDMSPLCTTRSLSTAERGAPSCVASGCLAHNDSTVAMHLLVTAKQKECLMELNRLLVEWGSRNGVRLDVGGRLTPQQLQKRVTQFRGTSRNVLQGGLLQQVLGVAQALSHSDAAKLQDQYGAEKLLLQNAVANGGSPVVQLLQSRGSMGLSLEDVIVLLTLLYSLLGEKALGNDVSLLKAEIVQAIYQAAEKNELPYFLQDLLGEDVHEGNAVLTAVEHMFEVLEGLGSTADTAKHRLLLDCSNPGTQPAVYKPLVQQLLHEILQDDPALPLEHHAGGLTDRIKAGFGFFRVAAKPHPRDNPVVILFVVGGVTASEAKLVSDLVASNKINKQVIVGGTALAKPREQLQLLFQRRFL